jgi:hypothetical protein
LQSISSTSQTIHIFLVAQETFSKIDHISGHNASHSKYHKTEIICCIFIGIKLELNYIRNYDKYSNTWRLNNTLLNEQWVMEEWEGGDKTVPGI